MRYVSCLALACALATSVWACRAFMPIVLTPTQATLNSDAVVVGTVKFVESEPVEVDEGGTRTMYLVAVVEIRESLLGAKGLTHARLLFGQRGPTPFHFEAGNSGCFFMTSRPDGLGFALTPNSRPVLGVGDAQTLALAEAKSAALAVTDPEKLLATADVAERCRHLVTVLQARHGRQKDSPQSKPVAASDRGPKCVLDTARLLPWSVPDAATGGVTFQSVFHLFQPEQRGFVAPNSQASAEEVAAYGSAAHAWLEAEANKNRLAKAGR